MRILRSDCRPAFGTLAAGLLLLALSVPGAPIAGLEAQEPASIDTPLESVALVELPSTFRGVLTAGRSPAGVQQELRSVVAKEVSVGQSESSLRLEFADGGELRAGIRDGVVTVDGQEVGRVSSSSDLEAAWRELLGRAVALENGPLARALVEWNAPEAPEGEALETGRALDQALEGALREPGPSGASAPTLATDADGARALARLLTRGDLTGLAGALEGAELDDLRIHVDEDVLVDEDEVVDGSLLVIDGRLEIRGRILGDVVAVGGTVRMYDGSLIEGNLRLADADLVRDGEVEGRVVNIGTGRTSLEQEVRDRVEREMEVVRARRHAPEPGFWDGVLRPFRWVIGGLGDLVGNLLKTLLLAGLGMAVVAFARENLEVVAETARRSPGRAAMVGVAGSFLILPVWVLGIVALAISIIGIPVLIVWLPLFPAAVALAIGFGYFAFAHNVGEWLSGRRYRHLEWIRSSNAQTLVIGGVLALMAPFLLSDLAQMFGPFLGFLQGLLVVIGVALVVFATMVGFGAVLLTRAGRRPDQYGGGSDPFDWDWRPTPRPSPGSGGPDRTGTARTRPEATTAAGKGTPSDAARPTGSGGSESSEGAAGPGASEAPAGGPAGTGADPVTDAPGPDLGDEDPRTTDPDEEPSP